MDKDHAKTIPISEILNKLNISPRRITSDKILYFSPFRNEKKASFWVYLDSNRWYDLGAAMGGDSIAFAMRYLQSNRENHTMVDALRWIRNMSEGSSVIPLRSATKTTDPGEPTLLLKSKEPIRYVGLIHYLEKRGIPLNIANKYLKQLRVQNKGNGKSFFALGFKNANEGYELRNPFFRGCIKPQTITFIRGAKNKPDGVHLFTGFMDYVSVIARLNGRALDDDVIVLNSISCLKMAFPYIRDYGYKTAFSWMDNDAAGDAATRTLHAFFKTQHDLQHKRMNKVYAPHKDVNAWHMHTLGLSHFL